MVTHTPYSTLYQLTQILNDGAFHDGESVGRKLGLSRTAIWKAISKLEQYGAELERIKKKGYRLKTALSLLDPVRLEQALKVKFTLFESIDSTQSALKQRKLLDHTPWVYIAEQQTQGRGRLDRTWHSPFGQNLYLTLRYSFQKDMSELTGLSLAVALSMAKAAEVLVPQASFSVKWPNDLVYRHQKLGGCLMEVQAEAHGVSTVWIGIGLNINSDPREVASHPPISQPWTSLSAILGSPLDRTACLLHLMQVLCEDLKAFEQSGFQGFQARWQACDGLFNQPVILQRASGVLEGIACGINPEGHLQVKDASGALIACASGDVIKTRSGG